MRIDQTHKNWFLGSIVGLLVAAIIYIPYDRLTLGGAAGGTLIGIAYGSVGFAFMLFAGLLSLRKRFPGSQPPLNELCQDRQKSEAQFSGLDSHTE